MKRFAAVLLCLLLVLGCMAPAYAAQVPAGVQSPAYLVMDAVSGLVLFGQQPDAACDPAALTKLMTLGMACEKADGSWDIPLTVSGEAVSSFDHAGASHISLAEGESASLADFLHAVMLSGANDACNVLAAYISPDGTLAGGVAAMNEKARALGLENTHFANSHGMTEAGHQSTPRELLQILRWALAQPGFADLFTRSDAYTMAATAQQSQRVFRLKEPLRMGGAGSSPAVLGAKSGYTDAAGHTCACLARQDGKTLLCVVLQAPDQTALVQDVNTILDEAFAQYRLVNVAAQTAQKPVSVRGGGQVLGTSGASVPGFTVLLHQSLGADALTLAETETLYTMGGTLPAARFTVDGGGVQLDGTILRPMQLTDLQAVIAAVPGQPLKRQEKLPPARKILASITPLEALALILAGILIVLTVIKVWQVKRNWLHHDGK